MAAHLTDMLPSYAIPNDVMTMQTAKGVLEMVVEKIEVGSPVQWATIIGWVAGKKVTLREETDEVTVETMQGTLVVESYTTKLTNHRVTIVRNPVVGMGATVCSYSDRYAGTIVAVSESGATITVREDSAHRTDNNGMSECQDYVYSPDPEGREYVAKRSRNGLYYTAGGQKRGMHVVIGRRNKYHDFSF